MEDPHEKLIAIQKLVERKIIIPQGLEVAPSSSQSQAGVTYLDRVNKKAYRTVDLTRYPNEAEFVKKDFWRKIEIANLDTTGLTPKIYSYDSENLTIEMELIEGEDFTHAIDISVETARKFMKKLKNFHKLGLFHGDLYQSTSYFLTPNGEIRLIDPSYIDMQANTIQSLQNMDTELALRELKRISGISKANIDAYYFETKIQKSGEFMEEANDTLLEALQQKNIQYVYQRGIGFSDGKSGKRFIETSNFGDEKPFFGTCVVIVGWSPETHKTCVIHADLQTDLEEARQQMENYFGNEFVDFSVIGGQTDNSEWILNEINRIFSEEKNLTLKHLDILGEKHLALRQVVVDTETGEIFDLQGDSRTNLKPWTINPPPEIIERMKKSQSLATKLVID